MTTNVIILKLRVYFFKLNSYGVGAKAVPLTNLGCRISAVSRGMFPTLLCPNVESLCLS